MSLVRKRNIVHSNCLVHLRWKFADIQAVEPQFPLVGTYASYDNLHDNIQ